MLIFSGVQDTIFTAAFQLNPKKWCSYFKQLLDSSSVQELEWKELIELATDAYRSIKSILQQDLYVWSNPLPSQDRSAFFRKMLMSSQLDQTCLDVLTSATTNAREIYSLVQATGITDTNKEISLKDLSSEERRKYNFQARAQLESIKRKSDLLKSQDLQNLKDCLNDLDSLLARIPSDMFNIAHPEFEGKFDLKDAHHDFKVARGLSRVVF